MLRHSIALIPFALSGCAALEQAERAAQLEESVALAEDFQQAFQAVSDDTSDGGDGSGDTTIPEGVELVSEEELNTRGSVSYAGLAGLVVPDGNENVIITAETDVIADFADNSVEVDFYSWIGSRTDENYSPIGLTGESQNANGDIVFANGAFVADGGAATFEGDVAGELDYNGDTYGVDGQMEGAIGTQDGGTENIAALANDETLVTINGDQVEGADFGFQAEIVE